MVCTDSSLPPPPKERALPTPSNSSMKRMQGACGGGNIARCLVSGSSGSQRVEEGGAGGLRRWED